ncbi:MAG: cation-translocating P-type ATPase [Candidatus Methylomirabilia bacterium]
MLNRWHAEDREVVLHQLGTDPVRGLAPAESTRRLREHGRNAIREPRPPSAGPLLLRQFTDALLLALLLAAALAGYLANWADCLALGFLALLNGLLGVFQEYRPDRALSALCRLSAPSARIVRGGKSFLVPSGELVPGDLAELAAGDRVAADMRLFAAQRLFADESALTGESLPVGKDPSLVLPEGTALADRANMLFAGTVVTAGSGTAIVTATGMRTEVGRIAHLLADAACGPTPLRKRLAELGQTLVLGALAVCGAAVVAGRLRGAPVASLLHTLVGLIVAIVPAGLPLIATAVLAIGVRRLGRRGVLVSSLPAAETLGAITVIGTDKTGTLTRNEMAVRELFLEGETLEVSGSGYAPEGAILRAGRPADPGAWETLGLALRIGALCSSTRLERHDGDAWRIVGDPTEGALLTLAAKGRVWRDELAGEHRALAEFPFTPERRRMTVVVSGRGGRPLALTKGAPDIVLAHCLHQRTAAGVRPLSPSDRERLLSQSEEMAGRALRVLGLAYREDAFGADSRAVERVMVWVGLVGMLDPPRPEVLPAIAECRAAGISPVIITGDHKLTALAVAREIGALRPGDEAISGEELDQLTPEAHGACIERYRVYARVTAEHKLRIIRTWRRRGHLVAMTGDGINDAPALREADIGIALGRGGTEVTREAAAIVIADGSFASIVVAVAEGRGIYENIRRFIHYLLAGNAAAALLLLAAALMGAPPPLLPVQLLWLSLVIGALPALALGLEPYDPELMKEGPRSPRERLLGGKTAGLLILEGAVLGGVALAAFLVPWRSGAADLAHARTHAFAVLAAALVVHAFGCRYRLRSIFSVGLRSNPWLPGAVALAGLLIAASVQIPLLGQVFATVPLARAEWLQVAALGLLPLPVMEILKVLLRSRSRD